MPYLGAEPAPSALSVTTSDIASEAVTTAKIADNAIDSEHYTDGSIDNAHIADDAIDSEHAASTQRKRQQVKNADLRWWRRVATALRKQNGTLSNLEIARRIDPRRPHTIRKYL